MPEGLSRPRTNSTTARCRPHVPPAPPTINLTHSHNHPCLRLTLVGVVPAQAVAFIGRQAAAAAPFFLYLPFQNIHAPYTSDEAFRLPYENKTLTPGEVPFPPLAASRKLEGSFPSLARAFGRLSPP